MQHDIFRVVTTSHVEDPTGGVRLDPCDEAGIITAKHHLVCQAASALSAAEPACKLAFTSPAYLETFPEVVDVVRAWSIDPLGALCAIWWPS